MTSDLLRDGDRILVHPLMLFAVYLLMAGHNRPGGGFVAGLTIGAAMVLRAQARNVDDALRLLPGQPIRSLAVGLLIAALVSLWPLLIGGNVLDQPFVEYDVPLFVHIKLTSAFAFDIGVALIVVGVVGAILEAFGDDPHVAAPSTVEGEEPA